MIEAGILDEWDKVELIGGEVVEMSAKGRRHSWSLMALNQALQAQLLPEVVVVDSQNPLILTDDSEPEPDVVVLRGPLERYQSRLATAADVVLLVEVSDSSLRFDREVKLPRYARASVPEVWIVDLTGEGGVERYTDPMEAGAYGAVVRFGRGDTAESVALQGFSVAVDWLLGPAPEADETSS